MRKSRSFAGIRLVLEWAVGTAVGSFLALPIAQVFLVETGGAARVSADELLVGGALGLLSGTGQWLVLRSRLARSGRWIPSSLIGGVVVGFVADRLGDQAGSLGAFGAYGIILGAFQWTVLKGRLRSAGTWVLASGTAWALGSVALVWLDGIALGSTWPLGELATVAIMYGLLGGVAGALTGAILAWMIKDSGEATPGPDRVAA